MKKLIICLIILSLALTLAACGGSDDPVIIDPPPLPPDEDGKIEVPERNPDLIRPLPEYPIIDGSTSTVIMHMAIRAFLTDEHFRLEHSQTYAALERLIPESDNPADVVLAVKYYDETLKDAEDRGADLVITPVAKEGFVFILHKDNPVNSLTQAQLRDIYSGKITNWKDVGGKDEEIIPLQRNWDSGSQTAMENFMDGEPIVGNPENIFIGMSFLLTQVQTRPNGIGYNIFSWATMQNLDAMDLKTVRVDNVKPENKTLSDSSYPLMVYTYSYYNRTNEKGKALTDWLLTDEGQDVIASAGYVGIFGALSTQEMPDFTKDEFNSHVKIDEFYTSNGYSRDLWSISPELRLDKEQTETLADGKGKDITVAYKVRLMHYDGNYESAEYRFIVLTRARGTDDFEVINEGAW